VIKRGNDILDKTYRGVEQLVARWAHNPKVAGSSPAPATQKGRFYGLFFLLVKHKWLLQKLGDFNSAGGVSTFTHFTA
jgi:hypothetical protein